MPILYKPKFALGQPVETYAWRSKPKLVVGRYWNEIKIRWHYLLKSNPNDGVIEEEPEELLYPFTANKEKMKTYFLKSV
jgi:hypothetical protein